MDDRHKAVIVVVLAAVTGITGVLTAEAIKGLSPGSNPDGGSDVSFAITSR